MLQTAFLLPMISGAFGFMFGTGSALIERTLGGFDVGYLYRGIS